MLLTDSLRDGDKPEVDPLNEPFLAGEEDSLPPPADCCLKGEDAVVDISLSLPLRGGDILVESLLGGETELRTATVALLLPSGETVTVEEADAGPPRAALRLAGEGEP